MWSRRGRGPCLEFARVLRTREGDRRVDVCWDHLQRDICNRGSEMFVACILVQRHEAATPKGVLKFHLCSVFFSNTPIICFSCRHVVLLERRFSLDTFPFAQPLPVGTFIRIDLFPCCCAAHSICPIESCSVSTRPCTLVAWIKLLHPSHLEVWFSQPCRYTHVSSLPGHRDTRALHYAVAR